MKKMLKSVACFILTLVMVMSLCPSTLQANAATKRAKLTSKTVTINVGSTKKIQLKNKPKGGKYTYKTSKKSVATVSKAGAIKGVKAGTATISVKVKPKRGKSYTLKLKAVIKNVKVTKVTLSETSTALTVDQTYRIKSSVSPSNATNKKLSYASSDANVAKVDSTGLVTGVGAGTAKITVTAQDGSKKYATLTVNVTAKDLKGNYGKGKTRTIVTTDGEVDDQDSFIRLMLYANEMDIEGIILTSSTYHYSGGTVYTNLEQTQTKQVDPYRWDGLDWVTDVMNAYTSVYPNLSQNADGYPTPEYLKSIVKIGNIKNVGDMYESTEGSDYIKSILMNDTNTDPLYIQTWGGTNTTARALYDIEKQYKGTAQWDSIYKRICNMTTIYIILSQDDTYADYIQANWPDIKIVWDSGTFWQFAYMWSNKSELCQKMIGTWMEKNILQNHGALLDLYRTYGSGYTLPGEPDNEQKCWESNMGNHNRYDFISEGDSPSYFYLIDNGLRSLEDPTYGGWAGRFEVCTDSSKGNSKVCYKDSVSDNYNGVANSSYKLTRWFDDIQDDFAARADWCVKSYDKCNHRPTVSVTEGVNITAAPGEKVVLHAKGTDPDGDDVSYTWWQYFEADTYNGSSDGDIATVGENSRMLSFTVPEDAQDGDTIHMIVEAQDDAKAPMKHYQRVIVTVKGRTTADSITITAPEKTDINNLKYEKTETEMHWGSMTYTRVTETTVELKGIVKNAAGEELKTGKTLTWSTSDSSIATVDSSGLVTLKGALGSVEITAALKDGSGLSQSITLTVTETAQTE